MTILPLHSKVKKKRKKENTESNPQPVGTKAKMEAKTSVTVRGEREIARDICAIASMKATPCTNRKIS